jgi:hypothetical protein
MAHIRHIGAPIETLLVGIKSGIKEKFNYWVVAKVLPI